MGRRSPLHYAASMSESVSILALNYTLTKHVLILASGSNGQGRPTDGRVAILSFRIPSRWITGGCHTSLLLRLRRTGLHRTCLRRFEGGEMVKGTHGAQR